MPQPQSTLAARRDARGSGRRSTNDADLSGVAQTSRDLLQGGLQQHGLMTRIHDGYQRESGPGEVLSEQRGGTIDVTGATGAGEICVLGSTHGPAEIPLSHIDAPVALGAVRPQFEGASGALACVGEEQGVEALMAGLPLDEVQPSVRSQTVHELVELVELVELSRGMLTVSAMHSFTMRMAYRCSASSVDRLVTRALKFTSASMRPSC